MQRHFVILDQFSWRGRLGKDGSSPSLQDFSPAGCFSGDAEDLIKLTVLLWKQILINMYFSLCGVVSMQTREGVYWGSASVLNSLHAEILQGKTQNAS